MLDENDIVSAILNSSDTQDALRVIARVAIREVALRANSAPPVEDVTVVGDMTIDRLRHTVTIAGTIRPLKPREFALIETLARRMGFVFSRGRLLNLAWPDPEGGGRRAHRRRSHPTLAREARRRREHPHGARHRLRVGPAERGLIGTGLGLTPGAFCRVPKPGRDAVARLSRSVDADNFDEPILYEIVEHFEVFGGQFMWHDALAFCPHRGAPI